MPDFFYDEQIRRYILQFMRIFADFKIELPPDENGNKALKRIPIVYGDMSRQVAQILNQNSANVSLSAPAMSVYIQAMELDEQRRRDTTNILPAQVVERDYDETTGTYSSEAGNRYTVERYMPVPYKMTMNLDIWTTNTTDKLQLIEQIFVIFNPSVQLQTNNNPLDYSAIFEVTMNGMSWSSRGVPQGADSNNDIMTIMFDVPIWINPPAKVKKQSIVEQIVTTLFDADISEAETRDIFDPLQSAFADLEQFIITPGNLRLEVTPVDATTSTVRLVGEYGDVEDKWTWETLTQAYGKIDPETTTLRLKTADDIETTTGDVLGTLETTGDTTATFTVDTDTLPTTIASGPVTAIIDPRRTYPGDGSLPAAAAGQRYLLVSDDDSVGGDRIIADNDGSNPWGSIVTYENDIIEYNGVNWFVSFDSTAATPPLYVTNTEDGQHYRYDGNEWAYTYLGTFNPGYWRIEI
jgi:hypothetical protein